jgi:ABC-type nitrate/sulfonate/bicarbonate transport system substrate-binding protein
VFGRFVLPRSAVSISLPHAADVHLGFVPLLDAAPLILALELGYFADEGLQVALHRQVGWGNVRDKLVYGQLHASHALVGMPPASYLGRDRFPEAVIAVMSLGTGGNAITLSRRLTDAGVTGPRELATWLARRSKDASPPALAHVFSCSGHHYLLRTWLDRAGIDPDGDVRLVVMPPPQMASQMLAGTLDGFCVGEPWGTLAEARGVGRIVAATIDLLPAHPEKVLAVNRHWLGRSPHAAVALVRAIVRACGFCNDRTNARRVAEVLSRPGYLDVPADLLARSMSHRAAPRHDPAATSPAHAAWILNEMIRWGHLPPHTDVTAAARASVDTDIYRRAVEAATGPAAASAENQLRTTKARSA